MKRKLVIALTLAIATSLVSVQTTKADDTGYLQGLLNSNKSKVSSRSTSKSAIDFVDYNESGEPIFIRGDLSKKKVTNKEEALNYIEGNMDAFKLQNGEFELIAKETDDLNFTHYKFGYSIDGINVRGAQIILHTNKDNEVYALNGSVDSNIPDKKYSNDFIISKEKAISIAKSKTFDKINTTIKIQSNKFVKFINNNWTSVYEVLIPTEKETILFTIDASTGEVLEDISTIQGISSSQVKGVGVYGNEVTVNAEVNKGLYYLRDISREGSIEVFNIDTLDEESVFFSSNPIFSEKKHGPVVDGLYHMGKSYDYFAKEHNRNSYDNNGGDILVDANLGGTGEFFDILYGINAFCVAPGIFGFGEGFKGTIKETFYNPEADEIINYVLKGDAENFISQPDIVAHEFTHAITSSTAGLLYENQSGALNESFSDVFGAIIEGDENDWIMGENVGSITEIINGVEYTSKLQRSLKEPELYSQPSHMEDFQYLPIDVDNGGVHTNSGIPNKAFYNIASKIGFEKSGDIYYRALTSYLTPTSQFIDARNALEMAALDLYGDDVRNVVAKAFEDVGVVQEGASSYKPALSSPNLTVDKLKNDGDFEITININKENTAKKLLIIDSFTGEIIFEDKIDTSKEAFNKTFTFTDKEPGIYEYVAIISPDPNMSLDNLDFDGDVNAGYIATYVGSELAVAPIGAINTWDSNKDYKVGQTINYEGKSYTCIQGHTSQNNWDPISVPALWFELPN